jgi:hypothetical protein
MVFEMAPQDGLNNATNPEMFTCQTLTVAGPQGPSNVFRFLQATLRGLRKSLCVLKAIFSVYNSEFKSRTRGIDWVTSYTPDGLWRDFVYCQHELHPNEQNSYSYHKKMVSDRLIEIKGPRHRNYGALSCPDAEEMERTLRTALRFVVFGESIDLPTGHATRNRADYRRFLKKVEGASALLYQGAFGPSSLPATGRRRQLTGGQQDTPVPPQRSSKSIQPAQGLTYW